MAENRGEFNEINITPLTDIFLVLLIIMMVIAPMLDQQGLNLTVPENVAEQVHNKDVKILTVRISPQEFQRNSCRLRLRERLKNTLTVC